ncbi:unnamed protein product [Ranitomeya imitator]|uniref:Uncharacterized protein n=1 Tax=Ranitomeya imitator TaxID=111125 RepID=A0ABN9MD33_9NEOB|nr:unnamed protein product [Ranitomeya imitator]
MLNSYISAGMGDVIGMALGGTALVFFSCSAYVLTTRKDMSFLGGMLMAGVVVVLVAWLPISSCNFRLCISQISAKIFASNTAAPLDKILNHHADLRNKEIETDAHGYLKNSHEWSEALAEVIASQEEILLTLEHWEVSSTTSPAIRMLVKAMANKFGEEKGNSRYLSTVLIS